MLWPAGRACMGGSAKTDLNMFVQVLVVSGFDSRRLSLDLAGTLVVDWQEGVGLALPDLVDGVAEMAGLGCFRRKLIADLVGSDDDDVLWRRFPS